MARAKRTDRAEARRRHRAEQAALVAVEAERADEESATERQAAPQRPTARSMFSIRPPDFRGDIAALPSILGTRRLIYLPLALVLVGFVAALTPPPAKNAQLTTLQSVEQLAVQLTLVSPSLLFFIQGFVAPRGAYLFGALLGVIVAALLSVLYATGLGWFAMSEPLAGGLGSIILITLVEQVVTGAIFAWFAAWYRDFLKRTQTRSRESADARKKEQRRQTRHAEARPRAR